MKEFIINELNGRNTIKLPTDFGEITPKYLTRVTEHINVADDYSLIALIYRENIFSVVNVFNSNKTKGIQCIPVFVKAGKNDSEFINNISVKDKLVVSAGDISLGFHVSSKNNAISLNNFVSAVSSDEDIKKKCLTDRTYCYFIDFKIVPNCAIHGVLKDEYPISTEFYTPLIKVCGNA
jgi:hypothetical protein